MQRFGAALREVIISFVDFACERFAHYRLPSHDSSWARVFAREWPEIYYSRLDAMGLTQCSQICQHNGVTFR
jgi:hypothetical protein